MTDHDPISNDEGAQPRGFRVGIDLGTTNSLVAHVAGDDASPMILANEEGEGITPSVVSIESDGDRHPCRFLVGRKAANNLIRDPENTVRSIKRFIGRSHDDPRVQEASQRVSYTLAKGEDGGVVVRTGENLFTPEDISAQVLAALKRAAELRLGGPVTHAVITIPAYFEEPQRVATRRAGVLAGLHVQALLDEPTAAALAEDVMQAERSRTLVFDFGGGTLDISCVQRSGGNLSVVKYDGDPFLGGDDIDEILMRRIREWIDDKGGVFEDTNPKRHAKRMNAIRRVVERAKRDLATGDDDANIYIDGICRTRDGEWLDADITITQSEFVSMLEPLRAPCANTVSS